MGDGGEKGASGARPAGWGGAVGRLLDRILRWLSRVVLGMRVRLGDPPRVQIIAFDGYAAGESWVVRGRVMEDRGSGEDAERGLLVRAVAKLKRTEIPRARVRASHGGRSWETTTDEEGYFRFLLPGPAGPAPREGWVRVSLELLDAPVPVRGERRACELMRVPRTATLGVLSDLDDTVVRSQSGDRLAMARRVLLHDGRERTAVEGAPELYRALRDGASGEDGNPFFYHSSASWDTYEHVHAFLEENGIPRGPMFLRRYSAESLAARSDVDPKGEAAREVLDAFPALPFLLIGDGRGDDDDARVYLEVVRAYGDRILAVYLRRGDDPGLTARLEEVVRRIRATGCEALLVGGSEEIAAHAAAQGWLRGEPLGAESLSR